ncbi:MAG: LamG-like jellyroll fold domain-containing protein [Acidobacteriota bacterium]
MKNSISGFFTARGSRAYSISVLAMVVIAAIFVLIESSSATALKQTPQDKRVPVAQTPPVLANDIVMPQEASAKTQSCGNSSSVYATKYGRVAYHIPYANTPIKTLLVNFNIMQKSDGSGNFQNTSEQIAGFKQQIEWVNGFYSGLKEPSDPLDDVPFISDARIRFELHGVYFYKDDNLWSSWDAGALLNAASAADPSRLDQINIFFSEGYYLGASGFATLPSESNLNNSYVVMLGASGQGTLGTDPDSLYRPVGTLVHELGHVLDLLHPYTAGSCCPETFNESDPDYLDDVFGIGASAIHPHTCDWAGNAFADPHDGLTNNLMGGNRDAGYLSPKQLGKIHRALALKSVRRYVKDCPKSAVPLEITSDEQWDFDMKLYSDVVIKNGATLTLQCKTTLPGSADITTAGGNVLYDGGQVIKECNTYALSVDLTPAWSNALTNQQVCLTAKVTDQTGTAAVGVLVKFDVAGANPASTWALTGADGVATFCYLGQSYNKYDHVTATAGSAYDAATVQWSSEADLSITKTASPSPATEDADLTYTIKVKNNGPSHAQGVKVVDKLPLNLTVISYSTGCAPVGTNINCNLGFLPSGSIATITIVLKPNSGGVITNQADVTSTTYDPNPANNKATVTTTVNPLVCSPLASDSFAWWPGNGGAGDVFNLRNGTLKNGAVATAPGKIGQAFGLDGVDDYVDLGSNVVLNKMTIETWVYVTAASNLGHQRIISKDNFNLAGTRKLFALKAHAGTGPAFEVLIGSKFDKVEMFSALTPGWHHLAAVRDTAANRFELYVDGVLKAQAAPTAIGPIDSAVNAVLGRVSPNYASEHFAGRIDEMTLYSRGLSAVEIKGIFNAGKAGKCFCLNNDCF